MLAMFIISILNKIIFSIFAVFILIPQSVLAVDVVSPVVTISATVNTTNGGNEGSGGGGGGGGINLPTIVNFSGMAYPLSKVYILKDGNMAVTTIADQAANFSVSLSGLSTNTYSFSVYGEDNRGKKSSLFSFSISVTAGTTVNIGNIFLSPTIDVDKSEVKQGDNLMIFGQSIPKNEVTISVHSAEEHFFKALSNAMGVYSYNLDTSILEIGNHLTKSKAVLISQISLDSVPASFTVGLESKIKDNNSCSKLRGDLNCDGRVNLVDFSIMAYWYKKPNPPANIDLNNDGKVLLIDFSIMVFNWTG